MMAAKPGLGSEETIMRVDKELRPTDEWPQPLTPSSSIITHKARIRPSLLPNALPTSAHRPPSSWARQSTVVTFAA